MANPSDESGLTLDRRFKLTKVIGRGPSGIVYSATDLSTGQPCAVKRLHSQFKSREVLGRVQRDALASAKITHPSLLSPTHSGFEPSGTLYLVSRLVQGESLAARLQKGPLSLTSTLAVIEPLCSALQAAHDVGLHHGSLTPGNVLCGLSGRVLLTDYGMCRLRETFLSQRGGALGYAAPETLGQGAEPATARGDVFSLGALLFECLTGQRMFSASSLATFESSVGSPPQLGQILPKYAQLDPVLEMACSPQPEERFATAGVLWRALQSSLLEMHEELERSAQRLAPVNPNAMAAVADLAPPSATTQPARVIPTPPSIAALKPGQSSDSMHPLPLPPPPPLPIQARPIGQRNTLPPPSLQPAPRAITLPPPPLNPNPPSAPAPAPVPVPAQVAAVPVSSPPPPPPAPPPMSKAPAAAAQLSAPALPPVPAPPLAAASALNAAETRRLPTLNPVLPAPDSRRRFDPQQLIATDPAIRLRIPAPPPRTPTLSPILWSVIGGVVVGGAMLTVQLLAGRPAPTQPAPVSGAAVVAPTAMDEAALLVAAQQQLSQRNFTMALGYAETLLRRRPEHATARALAEQAGELLKASSVYGGFLRAADRRDEGSAAALYNELPTDSPFRESAWEPFLAVRSLFVRRHLELATAALSQSDCGAVSEQVEKLHWVADGESDPALQQGQRLLSRCRRSGEAKRERVEPRDSELRDPFARNDADKARKEPRAKAEPVAAGELASAEPAKPKKASRRKKPAGEPGAAVETTPAAAPEKPEPAKMPSTLRNPFGP